MDEEIIILEDEIETIEEIEIAESGEVISGGTTHNTLNDRNEADSHTIGAITGLREELDKIETPRIIESNIAQQADYYKWEDENSIPTYPIGLFVSLYTGNIQLCDGTNDVFGVTVEGAGFVGNQAYTELENGTKIGREGRYNLVVHSGVVAVQKQTDVAVGDYVVPDAFGKAKKSDGKYGYIVTGLSELYGVQCAVISLSAPSTIAQELSYTLFDAETGLSGRITEVEKDIGNLTTFTNDTYELAQTIKNMQDTQSSIQESTNSTQETVGDLSNKLDDFEGRLEDVEADTATALQRSAEAQADAANIRTEAVAVANEAIADVEAIQKDIEALDYQIAPYSVGEYSQAYGLTWGQAKAALTVGQVHIPTVDPYYEEFYDGYEEVEQVDGTHSNIQKFSRTYYYTWNGIQWIPSNSNAVTFAPFDTTNTTMRYWYVTEDTTDYKKGDLVYWNDGNPEVVASITDNGFSRAVNYLRKTTTETAMEITNARGDCASLTEKLDSDGARVAMVASVVTEMKDVESSGIFATVEELPEALDANAYYCVGASAPYDVYKWDATNSAWVKQITIYYDGVNFCKINTASIVTAVNNDGDSSIKLNADKIKFTAEDYEVIADNIHLSGYVTFDNLKEADGTTTINGENITTGKISAEFIDTAGLQADYIEVLNDNNETIFKADKTNKVVQISAANIDGKLTTSQIDATGIEATDVTISGEINATSGVIGGCEIVDGQLTVNNLSSMSANIGAIRTGSMQSFNYSSSDEIVTYEFDFSEGLEYKFNSDSMTYQVTGIGTCRDKKIIIPKTYDGYPVTSINSSAFRDCSLTDIVIPDSVTSIGSLAFVDCCNLTSIKIPDGVTEIKGSTFYGCYSLTKVVIPDSVTSIGSTSFANCNSLISIEIPDGVTSIGLAAFRGCKSLTAIKIPDGVKTIETYAFCGCKSLINVTISNSVENIKAHAFEDCKSLTSITLPNHLTTIRNSLFSGCDVLSSVIIPESVISIGDNAFLNCSNFNSVYYWGDETKWLTITISETGNDILEEAIIYYYSDETPTNDGNFWHYNDNPKGFQISCDNHMIDSEYFKVASDGKIETADINNGTIGDLKIDNGIKGYIDNEQSFALTSEGLEIINNSAQIKVGNAQLFCDEDVSKVYLQTSGVLYIQGTQSDQVLTSIELMGEQGSELATSEIKLMLGTEINDSSSTDNYQNIYGKLVATNALFFSKTFTFYCRTKDSTGKYYVSSKTLTLVAGDTESQKIHLRGFGTQWIAESYANYKLDIATDNEFSTFTSVTIGGLTETYDTVGYDFGIIQQYDKTNLIKIMGNIIPKTTNSYTLGNEGYAWSAIYTQTDAIVTSDKNKKNTINSLDSKYSTIFDNLRPVTFKYNDNTSDRLHLGFIAQEVKEAMDIAKIESKDFAGYCEWENKDGSKGYGLRYEEFIPLNVYEIQQLKKRVEELENEVKELRAQQND